jgi:hypothetical protein
MGTPNIEGSIVKRKEGIEHTAPANSLNHALFVLNFLNVDKQEKPATEWFWGLWKQQHPLVMWKDPLTGQWLDPDPVLMWGKKFPLPFSQRH